MIIIPEIETVVILVPRTGSGSLYRAVLKKYKNSFLLYRHMEADGIPIGYDRWRKVGVVRHPLARLWSFYNYARGFDSTKMTHHEDTHMKYVRESVAMTFDDWVLNNWKPFTLAHDLIEGKYYKAQLSRRHPLPENRISQFVYLRPDLGTEVFKFENLAVLFNELGINTDEHRNASSKPPGMPLVSQAVLDHICTFCSWEIEQKCLMI
jgi:hypothetical protein